MLVSQEYLIHSLNQAAPKLNSILKIDGDCLGYIDLFENCRVELHRFTQNNGITIHRVLIGDQVKLDISSTVDYTKVKDAITDLFDHVKNGSDKFIREIMISMSKLLLDDLLALHQAEYLETLSKEFAYQDFKKA